MGSDRESVKHRKRKTPHVQETQHESETENDDLSQPEQVKHFKTEQPATETQPATQTQPATVKNEPTQSESIPSLIPIKRDPPPRIITEHPYKKQLSRENLDRFEASFYDTGSDHVLKYYNIARIGMKDKKLPPGEALYLWIDTPPLCVRFAATHGMGQIFQEKNKPPKPPNSFADYKKNIEASIVFAMEHRSKNSDLDRDALEFVEWLKKSRLEILAKVLLADAGERRDAEKLAELHKADLTGLDGMERCRALAPYYAETVDYWHHKAITEEDERDSTKWRPADDPEGSVIRAKCRSFNFPNSKLKEIRPVDHKLPDIFYSDTPQNGDNMSPRTMADLIKEAAQSGISLRPTIYIDEHNIQHPRSRDPTARIINSGDVYKFPISFNFMKLKNGPRRLLSLNCGDRFVFVMKAPSGSDSLMMKTPGAESFA